MYFDFLIVNYLNVFYFTSALVSLQYDDSPLHIASANGHEAVVKVFLKADADHSITNNVSMVQCISSSSLLCFINIQ